MPTNNVMNVLRRARRRPVAVLAVAVALVAGSAVPGGAQEPTPTTTAPLTAAEQKKADILERTLAAAPDAPPSPDDVFVAPIEARKVEVEKQTALAAAQVEMDRATVERASADDAAAAAAATQLRATATRNERVVRLAAERKQLSDLTVKAYVTGGDYQLESWKALMNGDTTDANGGAMTTFEQVVNYQEKVTNRAERALDRAETALTRATSKRNHADGVASSAADTLSDRTADRDAARADHDEAVAAVDRADRALRNAPRGGQVPLETALIGLPRLSGDDLATWFAASPYRSLPRIATPIDDIAHWFVEEGAAEGIRGDIAFAQAVLETGGFSNNDSISANNYSGIGHCDTCGAGWAFPSARDGVRAQIQLLKSYAMRNVEYTEPIVDRRLRGPAGCCPTWGGLTTVWATDPGYGPKVMSIYSGIVDHALARRAAGIGLDDGTDPTAAGGTTAGQ
jgi:hypothetical protein